MPRQLRSGAIRTDDQTMRMGASDFVKHVQDGAGFNDLVYKDRDRGQLTCRCGARDTRTANGVGDVGARVGDVPGVMVEAMQALVTLTEPDREKMAVVLYALIEDFDDNLRRTCPPQGHDLHFLDEQYKLLRDGIHTLGLLP